MEAGPESPQNPLQKKKGAAAAKKVEGGNGSGRKCHRAPKPSFSRLLLSPFQCCVREGRENPPGLVLSLGKTPREKVFFSIHILPQEILIILHLYFKKVVT